MKDDRGSGAGAGSHTRAVRRVGHMPPSGCTRSLVATASSSANANADADAASGSAREFGIGAS